MVGLPRLRFVRNVAVSFAPVVLTSFVWASPCCVVISALAFGFVVVRRVDTAAGEVTCQYGGMGREIGENEHDFRRVRFRHVLAGPPLFWVTRGVFSHILPSRMNKLRRILWRSDRCRRYAGRHRCYSRHHRGNSCRQHRCRRCLLCGLTCR